VKSEVRAQETEHLVAAGRFLAERRSFGMIWIDTSLVVRRRFGPLVDFVTVDRPITESIIALIGIEEECAALRAGSDGPLTIPNVIMNNGPSADIGPPQRVSLDVYWDESAACHLMLVRNVVDHSSLESELRTQMRLRAMAEAEVVEKSEAIQRANQELALVNRDLEEFAYVISHDLKAPLRALRFDAADADRALTAGDLDAVAAKLTAMRDHQARMLAMLNGLFDYARAGRKIEGVAMSDTRQLAEDVVTGLAPPAGMAINIEGSWPHLMTLAAPLELVLRNLVGNAVKHHDRPCGRILLSARIGEDTLDITVRDDGPGIPPEWQEAVFLPFRRMDESDGAESSGMGLALVRRTLDRIGGSIRLQSGAPTERGTTFHVRWPRIIAA
jgi:signal transduction histidine kinase